MNGNGDRHAEGESIRNSHSSMKAIGHWFWQYIQSTSGRAKLVAIGAAIFWGTWGFLMNFSHGTGIALQVAATQGSLNFITNLVGILILEFFYFRFGRHPLTQSIIAFIGTYCITLSIIISTHLWVGTPELLRTIGPSVGIGMVLTVIYLTGLTRLQQPFTTTSPQ